MSFLYLLFEDYSGTIGNKKKEGKYALVVGRVVWKGVCESDKIF